jgi:hypothetical protein
MITPAQAADQLRKMANPRPLHREVANAFRRGARRIEKRAEDRFTTRGVGRRLFGRKKAGARKLFSVSRVKTQGGVLSAEITVKGLAAIQETGGVTRPHLIKPGKFLLKGVPVLVFRTPRGLVITSKPVRHPGAMHPAIPSLAPEFEAGIPDVTREVEAAVEKHVLASLAGS